MKHSAHGGSHGLVSRAWWWKMLAGLMLLSSLGGFSGAASADNYTLWINGRGEGGAIGNYQDFTYWGPGQVNAGVNKRAVNWDGRGSIAEQNGTVRKALDCFCTGSNWCYIAAYSAGDPMIGYSLANFGSSQRPVTNAAPDVRTTTIRAMYNHNDTAGVMFYMYAGARGTLYSFILPGQDDEVVAYHSSGAVSGSGGGAYCNPRDWFCRDLTLGDAPTEGGTPKWNQHSVTLRDDGERYTHYLQGNWQGITAPMRADVEATAL